MRISFATHMPWSTPEKPVPTYFREQIENQLDVCNGHMAHPRHGRKKHTLRRMNGERLRFREGMQLQLVQGPRFKAEQFAVVDCRGVQVVRMTAVESGYGYYVCAEIGDRLLSTDQMRELAKNDGFYNYAQFERWFLLDLLKNVTAAMRREHRSCVGKMPHSCMFLAGVVIGSKANGLGRPCKTQQRWNRPKANF